MYNKLHYKNINRSRKKTKIGSQNYFLQSFEVENFAKIRHIHDLYLEKNM